ISKGEILASKLVSFEDYVQLERYTYELFDRGTEMAKEKGLILVDTKYECGKYNDQIILIDEVHTPDSSRFFYAEGYEEKFMLDQPQKQLSKEFVRQWLIANNFQGKEGQKVPTMPQEMVKEISERYIELYEKLTGEVFERRDNTEIMEQIRKSVEENI